MTEDIVSAGELIQELEENLPAEYEVLNRVRSENGALLWSLPDKVFHRWWDSIPDEERTDFMVLYGGTPELGKFCCALELVASGTIRSNETLVDAYAIAYVADPDLPRTKSAAIRAYRHDAVQFLLGAQHQRAGKYAALRIQPAASELIEQMLKEAKSGSMGDKHKAITAATSFLKVVGTREAEEKSSRLGKALERARQAALNPGKTGEAPTPSQVKAMLKTLKGKLGAEAFDAILNDV